MKDGLSIGIAGSKFAAGFHAECWEAIPGTRVDAVASRDTGTREAFRKKHHIAKSYDDLARMLADKDIDLVDICTPNYLHAEMAVAAMKAGKDVLCEKPLATTVADGEKVVQAQKETGRRLFYAEDWIFAPALVRARAIIAEGGIGKPVYLRAKESHNGSHSPYAQTIAFCGGGSVMHLAVHPIGFFQHLLGTPKTVVGRCSGGLQANLIHHKLEGEDWGMGILTYADGTQAVVEGNYVTAGGMDDTFEAYGSDGVLKVQLTFGSPLSVYSRKGFAYAMEKTDFTHGWTRPAVDENESLGYRTELAHVAACLRGQAEQEKGTLAADGLQVLKVIDAIYRSHREGRSITL
jgi:predicted dehydrogenase